MAVLAPFYNLCLAPATITCLSVPRRPERNRCHGRSTLQLQQRLESAAITFVSVNMVYDFSETNKSENMAHFDIEDTREKCTTNKHGNISEMTLVSQLPNQSVNKQAAEILSRFSRDTLVTASLSLSLTSQVRFQVSLSQLYETITAECLCNYFGAVTISELRLSVLARLILD